MEPRNRFERRRAGEQSRCRRSPLGYSPQQTADRRANSSKSTVYRLLAAGQKRAGHQARHFHAISPAQHRWYEEASLPPFESRATTETANAA